MKILSDYINIGLILLLVGFVYRFIYRVYKRVLNYRKQGQAANFTPLIGDSIRLKNSAKTKGDFCHQAKNAAYWFPESNMIGNAFFDRMHFGVYGTRSIQDVLQNQEQFYKSPKLISIQKLLLGDGLLFAEGAIWKKHRKYSSLAFHYDSLKNMLPEVYNIANELLDSIKEESFGKINIIEEIQKITSEVIGRLFFGTQFKDYHIDNVPISIYLEKLCSEATVIAIDPMTFLLGVNIVKMGIFPSHRRLMNKIKLFREYSRGIVREIIKNLKEEDEKGTPKQRISMIEIFYEQMKYNPEDPLTEEELVSLFISFFAAGMDTTGHLVGMTTYFLIKNPELKPKLLKEINSFITCPSNMTAENLNTMDFTTAVLKETLRMVPPTPFIFPRQAYKDCEIGGVKISKEDIFTMVFISANFNSKYHEEPNKFDPDRWLSDSLTKRSIAADPYIFMPFSGGSRNCIGQHLAMFEAKILLGLFLKKYDFELADKNYKIRYNFRFLYEPDEPLIYKLTKLRP